MLVPENLIQARRKKKLSQRELGEMIGVSGAIIGLYEKGTRSPRPPILQKLAEALDVEADWLKAEADPSECWKYKMELEAILKLVGLLDNPQEDRNALTSCAQLYLALIELQRAMSEDANDGQSEEQELESLRRMKLFAKIVSDCFTDLQQATPGNYSDVKKRFGLWKQEKQKLDDLVADYLKLNPTGQKIISSAATALTVSYPTAKTNASTERNEPL